MCPTGYQAYLYKAALLDVLGVENIRVDTIQGVLNYKRPGKDSKVRWSPPSALRRIDLILCDEASQYEDREWQRFFTCIKEQPHSPYVVVVSDFQQLQPVASGGLCKAFCDRMQKCPLDTVHRSTDEEHKLFCNRIRCEQLDRRRLEEYFGDRHWQDELLDAVRRGMRLAEEAREVFAWLTCTNKGASEVCKAALKLL